MNLLLLSTSTLHGGSYLEYCRDTVATFFAGRRVLFVPYARPSGMSHAAYADLARKGFAAMDLTLDSVHHYDDVPSAVAAAEGVFIGGGNTFVLLDALYQMDLLEPLRRRVAEGMPYMGSSAGTNVAGLSIGTTNDMPIVYPPSFAALGLLPCNFNPHYQDADPNSRHQGETRETRLREFHAFNLQPVVALREGAWLRCQDETCVLDGTAGARLFSVESEPEELTAGAKLEF